MHNTQLPPTKHRPTTHTHTRTHNSALYPILHKHTQPHRFLSHNVWIYLILTNRLPNSCSNTCAMILSLILQHTDSPNNSGVAPNTRSLQYTDSCRGTYVLQSIDLLQSSSARTDVPCTKHGIHYNTQTNTQCKSFPYKLRQPHKYTEHSIIHITSPKTPRGALICTEELHNAQRCSAQNFALWCTNPSTHKMPTCL